MFRQHPPNLYPAQVHIQHNLHHPEEQQQYQHRDHAGSNDHHRNCLNKMIQGILHLLHQFFGRNRHIFHNVGHRVLRTGKGILGPVKDIRN